MKEENICFSRSEVESGQGQEVEERGGNCTQGLHMEENIKVTHGGQAGGRFGEISGGSELLRVCQRVPRSCLHFAFSVFNRRHEAQGGRAGKRDSPALLASGMEIYSGSQCLTSS